MQTCFKKRLDFSNPSEPLKEDIISLGDLWRVPLVPALRYRLRFLASLPQKPLKLFGPSGGYVRRHDLLRLELREVDQAEKPVIADIQALLDQVTVPFRQIVVRQVPDQAFGLAGEALGERDLLLEGHLEDLVGVLVHEGRPAHVQLIHEDAKRVPVDRVPVALVQNHFGWDVLRRPAQRVRAHPGLQTLHEPKIGQLDEPVLLKKYVFWLQVAINEILPMHVLENQHNLRRVKPDQLR